MTSSLSIPSMLRLTPVVPVVTLDDPDSALPLAECLLDAGVRMIELTLRTDAALPAIERIARELPAMTVAVGTVTTADQLRSVQRAGARMAISPGNSAELMQAAQDCALPYLPGVATATELMAGLAAGLTHFKLFPASLVGGIAWLQAIGGPFPQARFCPTGGIARHDVAEYLAQPNVLCVGASWLASRSQIQARQWELINRQAREALAEAGTAQR